MEARVAALAAGKPEILQMKRRMRAEENKRPCACFGHVLAKYMPKTKYRSGETVSNASACIGASAALFCSYCLLARSSVVCDLQQHFVATM